jgi:hypothetical protein
MQQKNSPDAQKKPIFAPLAKRRPTIVPHGSLFLLLLLLFLGGCSLPTEALPAPENTWRLSPDRPLAPTAPLNPDVRCFEVQRGNRLIEDLDVVATT